MYSVIIPVYNTAEFTPLLCSEFERIHAAVQERFGLTSEFVFVVDASPDDSYALLREALPKAPFPSQLLLHARNFGSFAAIRSGLQAARGDYFGVISADLQEPPDILLTFLERLVAGNCDIAVGVRESRDDPAMARFSAGLFWRLYRYFVIRDIPPGGVDVFGCNRRARDDLLKLKEAHSSLVGLIFWLGLRRSEVGYQRRPRAFGKSAWTFGKKARYLVDSVYSFSDLPVRTLTIAGLSGLLIAAGLSILVLLLRVVGQIEVPGYTATVLIITFFGALNALGLGLVGSYAWRAYENTKGRPQAVLQTADVFEGRSPQGSESGCDSSGTLGGTPAPGSTRTASS